MKTSEEFGELVSSIKNELGSFGKLAIKTSISKAYLVELAAGKVPGPEYIEKLADAFPDQAAELYGKAGYSVPAKWQPGLSDPRNLMKKSITLIYESRGGRTPEKEAEARRIFEEILAEEQLEHINGAPDC